ncbi:MAG TPA: hypothetical protein PKB10_06780, partial [Tepidisphaeraceae bacterium]|nr:hypothetical protein [Tepidisphaeraceae bacterium]
GQKPEQVEPSRLAGAIRDMEALLRVAQMRAGGLEAEPIATVTDQLVIAQEHLAGGDAPAGLERVQRAMRTVRALVRQLEARAALGDALAIEQLADEAHRPARDRLTRDLRDRVRLLDIGPPGDDLPARLREIAGQDDPAPPTDLPEWYEAESASRERVRARARAEALRERPDPARLRTLRRLGGADDGWTLPVTVEFDEDRRALLSLAAGYRLIAMLPAELAPLMPGWMQAQLTVERPLVGWRAAAWDAIGRVMLVEDADEARWMIDALQPLRPMSDAAIDTLEQHILPLLPDDVSGFDREPDPPVLRRAREQLQRDLATVVLAMHEFDPEGGVQIA